MGLKKRGVEGDGEEAAPDVVVVGVVVDGGEGVQDQGPTGCFSELYEKVTLVIYTALSLPIPFPCH